MNGVFFLPKGHFRNGMGASDFSRTSVPNIIVSDPLPCNLFFQVWRKTVWFRSYHVLKISLTPAWSEITIASLVTTTLKKALKGDNV